MNELGNMHNLVKSINILGNRLEQMMDRSLAGSDQDDKPDEDYPFREIDGGDPRHNEDDWRREGG